MAFCRYSDFSACILVCYLLVCINFVVCHIGKRITWGLTCGLHFECASVLGNTTTKARINLWHKLHSEQIIATGGEQNRRTISRQSEVPPQACADCRQFVSTILKPTRRYRAPPATQTSCPRDHWFQRPFFCGVVEPACLRAWRRLLHLPRQKEGFTLHWTPRSRDILEALSYSAVYKIPNILLNK
jgi:hypothetical protein